jgi:hypothetical protein
VFGIVGLGDSNQGGVELVKEAVAVSVVWIKAKKSENCRFFY